MNLFDRIVVGSLRFVPKSVVSVVSRRYIAGETLEDALAAARNLNQQGFLTTIDLLGEDTSDLADARQAARNYHEVLEAVGTHKIEGNISVKPTQFGLKVDYAECHRLFRELASAASSMDYFVRVEMEDSTCTSATMNLYEALLQEFDNVGVVIQAYLHRSRLDIERLLPFSANVRVVKGVYLEPASIAYQDAERIRDNYVALSEMLLRGGSFVAFATHDESLIQRVSLLVEDLGLPSTAYEFQMLLGVGERIRQRVLESGKRMRVYIPFGPDWYPYSIRRLRENPKIAGYVVRGMLGRS